VKAGAVYFAAAGGAGVLLGRSITSSKVVCFEELGPEAVYRLEVKNMPLVVAVDSKGNDLYKEGPAGFRREQGNATT
jgi:fumarate hydratase subunit beta